MQPKLGGHTPTKKFPAHLKFGLPSNKTWKFMVSKFDENPVYSQFLCANNDFAGYMMIRNHSEPKKSIFQNSWFITV